MAREGEERGHVDGVDVRAFLAVDLDAHEARVHECADVRVGERLAGHDVAPVAGRVADGEEHGDVALASLGEGLVGPFVPVDGVRRVLAQVRGQGVGEAVRHGGSRGGVGRSRPSKARERAASRAVSPVIRDMRSEDVRESVQRSGKGLPQVALRVPRWAAT